MNETLKFALLHMSCDVCTHLYREIAMEEAEVKAKGVLQCCLIPRPSPNLKGCSGNEKIELCHCSTIVTQDATNQRAAFGHLDNYQLLAQYDFFLPSCDAAVTHCYLCSSRRCSCLAKGQISGLEPD